MFRWRRINGKQAQYRQQDVNSSSWKASGSIKTWFMPDIWCCVLSSIMNRTERKTASQVTPSQCGSGTGLGLGQGCSSPGRSAGGRADWRLQNGIMMYEGETEKESRDSLNMVEQMKIMYGAINLAVIHGAPLRSLSGLDQSHFLASQP